VRPLLPILHREPGLVVVDKPSGLSVHRGWDGGDDVAMTRLRAQLGQWVWPVHRLDRGTSGCLLFALDEAMASELGVAFAEGRAEKSYVALVRGALKDEAGRVDHPVRRSEGGERIDAVTDFVRLAALENATLVLAWPRTGRLHQIRQHFRHLGHPLLGDTTWGDNKANKRLREPVGLHRLALHALALSFPSRERVVRAMAPIPEDLAGPLRRLGLERDALEAVLASHRPAS
jgi:tRNA pseudouridine65 synthase